MLSDSQDSDELHAAHEDDDSEFSLDDVERATELLRADVENYERCDLALLASIHRALS